VRAFLAPRQQALAAARDQAQQARSQVDATRLQVAGIQAGLAGLRADLAARIGPFHAQMSIDQAWRRHPGAPAVFARHHLPACDGCAVRFDETVEEAARAYGLDLPVLLAELGALLGGTSGSVPR